MRIALTTLLTAIVLFFFGFVWWGVIMPIAQPAGVIQDTSIVERMSSLGESGVYFHPTYTEAPSETASGPMVVLYYVSEIPSMGMMMGLGFAHMLAASLLACLAVNYLNPATFSKRFLIVCGLGLFTALWADVGNMIWWHHPASWAAYHFGYDLFSWVLAGLVIAALLKPTGPKQ